MRRDVIAALLVACLFFALGSSVTAQPAGTTPETSRDAPRPQPSPFTGEAPTLRFEHLGLADGLRQSTVYDILQDRQGFIWIATGGGLHRYDGYGFEVYAALPFDSTGLSSGWTKSLAEAADGDLWVGTLGGGLNRLDPATGRAVHYRHDPDDPESLRGDHVYSVLEASDGSVWVATKDGTLSRMRTDRPGHFEHIHRDPDDPAIGSDQPTPRILTEDSEGYIWKGMGNGLLRVDPRTGTVRRYLHEPGTTPSAATITYRPYVPPGAPGTAWVPTERGLVRLDTETGAHERFLVAPGEEDADSTQHRLYVVVPDPNNPAVLWAGGSGAGVVRFDTRTETFSAYRHDQGDPHSPISDDVFALAADRSGMLWVGTPYDGLSVFNPKSADFVHLRHDPDDPESLAPGRVFGVLYEDRSGVLWAGSQPSQAVNYITRLDSATGRAERYRHNPGDPASILPGAPSGIAEDAAGNVWVGFGGAEGGLVRFDGATGDVTRLDRPRMPNQHRINSVTALLPTASDSDVLWVGGPRGGLHHFDTRTGRVTTVSLELDSTIRYDNSLQRYVSSLHEDAEGTLWIGTLTGGLVRRDTSGTARRFTHDARDTTTLSSNRINDVYEREREPGVLWVPTYGGGLNRFDTRTGTATHYTEADGLPDNHIYGILEDDAGTLWMSTNNGIASFDPETETFRSYGLDDGLMALEFEWKAFAKGAGGVFYFGNTEGVTLFSLEHLSTNVVPPQVVLTGLRISNAPIAPGPDSPLEQPLSETEQIRLPHDQNEVRFDYVALHFQNPEKNRYAYRLDGFDREWVEAGEQRAATYTNLPPGRYTFRVKAANSDGVWNEEGASVGLAITPPWWRTWWAYAFYALLFAGGIFAVDHVQRRRLIARERARAEAREQERERQQARQLKEAYDTLEVSMQRLTETQDQLIHSEKMASLGALTAGIAHEIKNPLNFVTNFAEVNEELAQELTEELEGEADPEEMAALVADLKQNAGLIRHHGQRADSIVKSMMAHARGGGGEREIVDLNTFVEEYVGLAYHGQRARVTDFNAEIVRDYDDDVGEVELVPQEMGRVLINLLGNAFDAVYEHSATQNGKYAPTVRVSTRRTSGHVEVRVADNGPGIPDDVRARIFEPFFTTKPTGSGTGLGLSMSHDIIAQGHGGTLEVESAPGEGAVFVITLPARQEHAVPSDNRNV